MNTRWFYVADARRHGPVTFDRLIEALLARPSPESALVWHPGLSDWVRSSTVPEIVAELPPPVPGTEDFRLRDLPGAAANDVASVGVIDDGPGEDSPPLPANEHRRRRKHRQESTPRADRLRELALPAVITVVLLLTLAALLWKMFEVGEQLG